MSNIVLQSSAGGSGAVTIAAPETNTPLAYQLPKVSGKVSILGLRASVTASGTSIDFSGIPDDAQRIILLTSGLSSSGTANIIVQLGSTTLVTSGYAGSASNQLGGVVATFTTGLIGILGVAAANLYHGHMDLIRISGNTWVEKSQFAASNVSQVLEGCGSITLTGALDQLRLTTANGTDTFDAGIVTIMVE